MIVLIILLLMLITSIVLIVKKDISYDDGRTTVTRPFLRWAGLGILGLTLLIGLVTSIRSVDAGTVSIPVAFGTVGEPIGPGIHVVPPWVDLTSVSTRTQEYTMTVAQSEGAVNGDDSVTVNGSDGASAAVDSTLLFRIEEANADRVYREVGTNYVSILVRPKARECIRDAGTKQSTVDLVTTKREAFATAAEECIRNGLEDRGITVEDLQIREMRAAENIQVAIDSKVASSEQAKQKEFELAAARQDAEKKRIETQAISDGQQIVRCGAQVVPQDDGTTKVVPRSDAECQNQLTPEYLQWYYIDTMSKLAGSPNSTFIFAPVDQELTPLLPLDQNGG